MYSENDWRNYTNDELYHHGIKGQKWGVQNGPPYPLDQKTHDAVIKNERMYKQNSANMDGYPTFSKSDAGLYLRDHPVETISQMDRIKPGADIDEIRRGINHPGSMNGRYYNCPNCATAFDMTERGYDVIARPKPDGSNVENIEDFFKGGKLKSMGTESYSTEYLNAYDKWAIKGKKYDSKEYDKFSFLHDQEAQKTEKRVIDELKSQKDSRGIIVVGWRMDENPRARTSHYHALNYKVVNGEVIFYDTQSRREYKGFTSTDFIRWDSDPRDVYIMRTDNLEPSDRVGEAVISRRKA
jgi:hypothetical protein